MSTTWAARVAAREGLNVRLYFTIAGIPNVFQDDSTDVPSSLEASARPRTKVLAGIDVSPPKLDILAMRMEGGTLTVTMRDTASRTLAALFKPRAFRTTYVSSNALAADTSISIKSSAALSGVTTVYIGDEAVTFTSIGAGPTLAGCTRGAFGSTAQAHFGSTTDGAAVFVAPPTIAGRRLTLYSYFVNDDGTSSTDLRRVERVYTIEEAPTWDQETDTWTFRAADLSDEFFSRKLGGGIRDVELPPGTTIFDSPSGGNNTIVVSQTGDSAEANQFKTPSADRPTQVLWTAEDGAYYLTHLVSASPGDGDVTIHRAGLLDILPSTTRVTRARHIAIMYGSPHQIVMEALSSRLGDGANDVYDLLPGRDRAAYGEPQWRMGAGIAFADIDNNGLSGVSDLSQWSYIIDQEHSVADLMFEFCLQTKTIAYVTRAGKLSAKPIGGTSNTSTLTIDSSVIDSSVPIRVRADEGSVFPRVKLHCNYDPLSREFVATISDYDTELQARYPRREEPVEMSSKSLVVSGYPAGKVLSPSSSRPGVQVVERPAVPLSSVRDMLRRLQGAEGRPQAYVSLRCHSPAAVLDLGDIVKLTASIPDMAGATSVSDQLCRVISVAINYDDAMTVDLELQVMDKVFAVGPAAIIHTYSSPTITLNGGTPELGVQGGTMFAAGQKIQVWDVSAGTKQTRTITAVTATTITHDGAALSSITTGEDFVRLDTQGSGHSSTQSSQGFSASDYLYQMRDDESASGLTVTRWR